MGKEMCNLCPVRGNSLLKIILGTLHVHPVVMNPSIVYTIGTLQWDTRVKWVATHYWIFLITIPFFVEKYMILITAIHLKLSLLSLPTIKTHLKEFMWSHFLDNFDPNIILSCTYLFLCPCTKCTKLYRPPV